MKQKFYILETLIETEGCTSDTHSLYSDFEAAMEAMKAEISGAQENFSGSGRLLINLPTCKEWRDDNGFGWVVTVEEHECIDS